MAVVTTKSGPATDRDSTPRVPVNGNLAGGFLKSWVGTVEAANGDSIASKYVLCVGVPSNARVSKVLLSCDAISTSGAGDIGVYKSTADGGAVVDADLFASAQVITSALKNSDVTFESGSYGVEDVEKPLWEALGLTEDPNLLYDIVMTLTTATGGAGTVSLQVEAVA